MGRRVASWGASAAALLAGVGCADGRALLSVPVQLAASASTFEADDGTAITVTAASLTLSDLRLEAPPETAAAARSWSLLGTAHAHPGHDEAGEVAGELTGTWTLDLLAGEPHLGDADCYEGETATARVQVEPEPATLLEGVAVVAGQERPFSLALAPDADVHAVPFVATLDADAPPQALTLSVDLAHALSFIDWSTADSDGDGRLTTADGDLANTALFGVVSSATFSLALDDRP